MENSSHAINVTRGLDCKSAGSPVLPETPLPSKMRRGLPGGAGSTAQDAAQGPGPQLPPPDGIPGVPVQVTPSVHQHFAFPVSGAASWPPLHQAAIWGMEQWLGSHGNIQAWAQPGPFSP